MKQARSQNNNENKNVVALPCLKAERPTIADFEQIVALINHFAGRGEMLSKNLDEALEQAQSFRVIKRGDEILGVARLHAFTSKLAEIKSLAVKENAQGLGLGRILVEDCEKEAREMGIERVFALTYKAEFFERLGYQVSHLDELPEKVFHECSRCPFQNNCNEVAVLKSLS